MSRATDEEIAREVLACVMAPALVQNLLLVAAGSALNRAGEPILAVGVLAPRTPTGGQAAEAFALVGAKPPHAPIAIITVVPPSGAQGAVAEWRLVDVLLPQPRAL